MMLMEVMAAMLVGSVGLLGALGMTVTVMHGTTDARAFTDASALAQSRLEQEIARTPMPADGTTAESNIDAFAAAGGRYTRTTVWTTVADAAGTRRRVTVTVAWTDDLTHSVIATHDRLP